MNGKKKSTTKKTTTEPIRWKELFGEIQTEYLPFVNWHYIDENHKIANLEFISDKVDPYINKWDRQQWKISVFQEEEDKILSGGKRLFQTLQRFCMKHNMRPSELGFISIHRLGGGFDTKYRFEFFSDNKENNN